jgi:TP901 family phage tail tape measure protein
VASDLRNLTVRLSLDRLNFDQGLSSVNRALNTLRGELNTTRSGMGGFESETERLSSRIDVLNRMVAVQAEKVQQLRASYDASVTATGENSRASQLYANQVNRASAELQRLQGELTQTTEQLHRMESSTTSFSARMTTMGSNLQNAGMQIGMVFGSIAYAVGGALKNAVSTGAEFEAEIAKVGSKADASSQDLKRLSDAAIKLGPMAGGAKNAATAMDDLAAKGYSVNQILQAMPGIISAANASGEDLALTSDTITSALETFHLKATDTAHVADVLAKTANLTAAGMTDLQYTFKYAAAPAAQLGVSMEQLAAMTGLMANQGIKGEQAGTSLRAALLRLVKPPKQAANELHDLGVKVTDAHGKFRSFSDIIGDLNTKTAKMTNAEKAAAMARIFGTEAVSGMLAVISQGKPKIDQYTTALKNSDGASAKAAAQMKDNLAGSLSKLNGAIESAKIGIEQALAPALRVIADTVQKVVVAFNNLPKGMKTFISTTLAVVAVVSTFAAVLGGALAAVGGIMIGIGALGPALAGIAAPLGIIAGAVAGVVALGVGFYELYKNCKPVQDAINGIGNTIKGLFQGISAIAQGGANEGKGISILDSIGLSTGAISVILNSVNAVKSAFATVKQEISNIVTFVQGVANIAIGGASEGKGISMLNILGLSSSAITTIQTNIMAIKTIVSGILSGLWSVIQTIGNGISQFWKANGTQIMSFVSAAWNGIKTTISTIITAVKTIVVSILQAIEVLWKAHGSRLMAIISGAFGIIKSLISGALSFISGLFQAVFPIVSGVVQVAFGIIKSVISVAGDVIGGVVKTVAKLFSGDWKGAFETAKSTAVKIWNDIVNAFKGIDLYQIGVDIIQGLINGLGSMVGAVIDTIGGISSTIVGTIKKLLGIHSPSRVMMEIGGYVTEGMAIGMDSNVYKVLAASNNLANNAIPNVNISNTSAVVSSNGNNRNAQKQPLILQMVTPDNRMMAEWLVDDITDLQNFKSKRLTLFSGGR